MNIQTQPIIIVNADDLGENQNTNQRIIECFERGLISSASVLVNMSGFENLLSIKHKINKLDFGIHLNLTEGYAVSSEFQNEFPPGKLFYDGGILTANRNYLKILEIELENQVEKMINAGFSISHIDSHHHMHNYLPVASIFVKLAKKYNIPQIRMAQNICEQNNCLKRIYRALINSYFSSKLKCKVVKFGYLDKFIECNRQTCNDIVELMVHPGLCYDFNMLMSEQYGTFLKRYSLTNFGELYS